MQSPLQLTLDALALLLAKATFIGLRLLFLYLSAASLDRAAFGALTLAFTTAEICRYIGDWGMDTWALRQFSHSDVTIAAAHMRWVIRIRVASTLVASVLAWFAIGVLAPQPTAFQQGAITLTAATSLWLNLGVNWLQARSALRPMAGLLSLVGAACAIALVFGHMRHNANEAQLLILVVSELLMTVGVIFLAHRHMCRTSYSVHTFASIHLLQWWRSVTPIALSALIALAYGKLDQYFVSQTALNPAVLGNYALAQRIVEPVLFMMVALSSTIYARASTIYQSHGIGPLIQEWASRWIRLISGAVTVVTLFIGLLFTLLGPQWLPQYKDVQTYLWIALLASIFRSLNQCLTAFIQALGEYKIMFIINIVNFFIFTIFIILLGLTFGPIGTAVGLCLGEATATLIQFIILKRFFSRGVPIREKMLTL